MLSKYIDTTTTAARHLEKDPQFVEALQLVSCEVVEGGYLKVVTSVYGWVWLVTLGELR